MLPIKRLFTKKECKVVLWSQKHEEISFPDEFIFLITLYIIGGYCQKKMLPKGVGVVRKNIKGDGHIGGSGGGA